MEFTIINFGKFKGKNKTLAQILWIDPDWFFWCYQNRKFHGIHRAEATFLYRRAKRIAIKKGSKVEYFTDDRGVFAGISLVDINKPSHVGGSIAHYSEYIDMSLPRQFKSYDKLGGKIMIRALKSIIFGNSSARVTQQRAEKFFNDDSNFMLWKNLLLERVGGFLLCIFHFNWFPKYLLHHKHLMAVNLEYWK